MRGNPHARFGRRPGETERSKHRHRAPGRPHLGAQVVDEVRRRVQQDTLGHRGRKDDPLYKIRGLLRHGVEHLTDRQQAKLSRCLDAGDPHARSTWPGSATSSSAPSTTPPRRRAARSRGSARQLPHLPDPRGRPARPHPARLAAAGAGLLRHRRVSNGGTEAINLIIEKVRRLAHGFRDFDHYRLRILLAADGRRPYRTRPNHA